MKNIIKLTERQLHEIEGVSFEYIDGNDETNEYDAATEIAVNGTPGVTIAGGLEDIYNDTSDDIAAQITRPGWSALYGMYGSGRRLHEQQNQQQPQQQVNPEDKNGDNVDDDYTKQNGNLDTLSNGNPTDNLAVVPQTTLDKADLLLNAMRTEKLSGRQCAIVLNKIIENIDFSGVPYSWKKELRLKIN